MTKLIVEVSAEKCQGYGACVKVAPQVFRLDAHKKAIAGDPTLAPHEIVSRAARSCPYRAVIVTDAASGEQLVPRVRTK